MDVKIIHPAILATSLQKRGEKHLVKNYTPTKNVDILSINSISILDSESISIFKKDNEVDIISVDDIYIGIAEMIKLL